MKCLRCEIAKAKLRAILYHNMRWSAAELVNDLNALYDGVYYLVRNDHGAMVYRKSDVEGSPAIEIWFFH